jgi:flagellar basal body-associated protein FliL
MSKILTKTAANQSDTSHIKTAAVIIAALLLVLAASLFFNQPYKFRADADTAGNNKNVAASDTSPKFVDLGTFTTHMSGENGEQIIQTSLSLKLTKPGLETRAKASLPEIQHHVNMVLQSKSFSELTAHENREKLAQQVKQHVEYVMGFRRTSPVIGSAWVDAVPAVRDNGISAVLFTSFVIRY